MTRLFGACARVRALIVIRRSASNSRVSTVEKAALIPIFGLRERNGKASEDCASQGEIGSAAAGHGGSEHYVYGGRGTRTQGEGEPGGFVDEDGDDPIGQTDRGTVAQNQRTCAAEWIG